MIGEGREVAAGGMAAKEEEDGKKTPRAVNSNFRKKRRAEQAYSGLCRAWEARLQALESSC